MNLFFRFTFGMVSFITAYCSQATGNNNLHRLTLLSILAGFLHVSAQTILTGAIGKDTLTSAGNPYIIENDITLPSEKTCVISAGCVFLFKPFTRFLVEGTLVVDGTQENKVIFTSFNDTAYNRSKSDQLANPFDWNGIDVALESSGTRFKAMLLRFSVYGVKAQTPNLSLESCHFSHNGQQNFSIGKSLKYIEPGVPYTYEPPTSVAASISQNQKPSLGDWIKENRKPLRKGTLITGASGLVAGAVLLAIYLREKNDIENTDISSAPRKDIEQRITVNNRLLGISIGTFSLGVLGWGGFGLTFTIK